MLAATAGFEAPPAEAATSLGSVRMLWGAVGVRLVSELTVALPELGMALPSPADAGAVAFAKAGVPLFLAVVIPFAETSFG